MNPTGLWVLGAYLLGVFLGAAMGLDALIRAGELKVNVTTKHEAWRWLFGTPKEYLPEDQPGPFTRLITWLKGTKEAAA